MNLITILAIVFVVLTGADVFYFYLGKRGALDKIKDTETGRKVYNSIHHRVKHRVKKHSFWAVVGVKLLYGIATVGLIYLGERMKFSKFLFYDIIVNSCLCVIVYSIVSFLDARLDNVLAGINYIQTQFLLILAILIALYFLQAYLAKKGIRLI
jgi:membrane protein DedA with SNARE-associated domain